MTRTASPRISGPKLGLALTSAMATVMLSGCATGSAPPAALSASQAEAAIAKGQSSRAVESAEAAVLADPRNAAYRATLGSAYLDAGRFASAATSFDDAMKLGDTSPRTALSLALALAGSGKHAEAAAVLTDWQGEIAKPDLGLAYSLAGYPDRGIAVLSDAIRGGENTAKTRQNLAYSYALAGKWREARLMAAEDVPADMVSDRIGEWAAQVAPEAYQHRVAGLLGVPAGARDTGQPLALALNNNPSAEQLAVQSAAYAPAGPALAPQSATMPATVRIPLPPATPAAPAAAPAPRELPPIGDAPEPQVAAADYVRPVPVPASETRSFEDAFAASSAPRAEPVAASRGVEHFAQSTLIQSTPPRRGSTQRSTDFEQVTQADGTHLVQLGSFASEQGARRAWGIYAKRYPELAGHDMVITEAVVRGKRYWRVSAAGYDRKSSNAMCGMVKDSGEGCFAWAEGRPLPGAVDTGIRMARR